MEPDLSSIKPGHNYANLINVDPPIVVGWTGVLFPFGSASVLAPLFRRWRIVFLLFAKGSLADEAEARDLADAALPFMAAHPQHRYEWICNIDEETRRLRALGLSAHTHNQNLFLRDNVFTPLDGVERIYDAVYNGRLSPEKRNELAALIERVAFITYRDPGEHSVEAFHASWADLSRKVPGGRLLNALTDQGCARLSPEEVNAAYAQAHVGLCLSPREGAMRVAVEYQMAGLPIVGTPCRGGRDRYLDPETWTIVPPEPEAVRDAVEAMKARVLPRQFVRDRIMEKIEKDRRRFVRYVQSLIEGEGGAARFKPEFKRLVRRNRFERWVSMRDFAAEVWQALGGD